jgi:hypothetical protein
MNEQLSQALYELITKTTEAALFVEGQIPDVINQLLNWHIIYYSFIMLIGLVLFFGSFWVLFSTESGDDKVEKKEEEFKLGWVIALFMFIGSFFAMNMQWFKIWIAPKVWLIEYAAQLAK